MNECATTAVYRVTDGQAAGWRRGRLHTGADCTAVQTVCEKRQIFGQDNVHRLCLVGYAGDMPLVYYNSYLKSYVAERMYPLAKRWESQKKAFSTWDMYKDIEIRYLRMEQKITATIADSHIAKILHLPKGDPVIRVETYAYEKNMVVEYKIAYYRADKYSFNIVREVDNGE